MKEIITIVREYDENNNMIYYKDEHKEEIRRYNNNILEHEHFKDSNTDLLITKKYFKDFTISQELKLYESGFTENRTIYYDKDNNVIRDFYENGDTIDYLYKDGKRIAAISKNFQEHYEYDDNGNEIYKKIIYYPKNNTILSEKDITLSEIFSEYDDHNNLICTKMYINHKFIYEYNNKYVYYDNGNYEISNACYTELRDSEDRILYSKDENIEYWNEYKDNKIIYKDNKGYECVETLNEKNEVIYFKDNTGKEIEYVYEDKYIK